MKVKSNNPTVEGKQSNSVLVVEDDRMMTDIEDDGEGYENGLRRGVDTRPSRAEGGGDYVLYRRWLTELQENRTCMGYFRRFVFNTWFFVLRFNPLLAGLVTVVSTCCIFFTSLKAGNDDMAAFTQSFIGGTVTMLCLQMLSLISDRFSAFPEMSRPHMMIRNELHCSRIIVFYFYLVLLGVAAWALANINNYCNEKGKPCAIKAAFITPN